MLENLSLITSKKNKKIRRSAKRLWLGGIMNEQHTPFSDIIHEIENDVNDTIYQTLSKAEKFILNTEELRNILHKYYIERGKIPQAKAVRDCGRFLMFKQYKDKESTAQLARANFCKNPLCPMCAWRKHIKTYNIMQYAVEELQGKVSHLVLAIPNTSNITKERLTMLKERAVSFVRSELNCDDYFSSLEIVASEKGYHPHIHMLLCTKDFFEVSKEYILEMSGRWKAHFDKCDTETYSREYQGYTFYIRGLTGTKEELKGAILETTKYILKAESKIDYERATSLCEAVKGVRKTSAGGEFREGIKVGKRSAYIETEAFFRELSAYDWEYQIYNFINGKYKKR